MNIVLMVNLLKIFQKHSFRHVAALIRSSDYFPPFIICYSHGDLDGFRFACNMQLCIALLFIVCFPETCGVFPLPTTTALSDMVFSNKSEIITTHMTYKMTNR